MVLILLSWAVLFCFFFANGVAVNSVLKLKSAHTSFLILFGMAFQTLLLTSCAFFVPLGFGLFAANFALSGFGAYVFRNQLFEQWKQFKLELQSLTKISKMMLGLIVFSALLKCAQSPFIFDNECYYVQTIKWLNEYGFVNGLGNLNLLFGQNSGWHILQAGFNFGFITDRINDLNGFLLIVLSLFFISRFDDGLKNGRFEWIGFVILFNVLLFQFINSPSPDLPLILISQFVFYLFLKKNKQFEDVKIYSLLIVFMIFIKISIFPIVLLALYDSIRFRKNLIFLGITGFLFGFLWIAKNSILTGYPLFPVNILALNVDWRVSENVLSFMNDIIKNHEFLHIKGYSKLGFLDKFLIWIQLGGINSIFNKGIILLFVLGLFTRKFKQQSNYRILYFVLLVHFIFLLVCSPQFRFFLADFVFLSALLVSDVFEKMNVKPKFVQAMLLSAVVMPLFVVYLLDLKNLTENRFNQNPETVKLSMIYLLENNSKFSEIRSVQHQIGNLNYYSPDGSLHPNISANGPLPCTNNKIIIYFETRYKVIPQLRTQNLKDGFYSAKKKD